MNSFPVLNSSTMRKAVPHLHVALSGLLATSGLLPGTAAAQAPSSAGSATVIEMSMKEMQRREAAKQQASVRLSQAQQSMALKDYDAARQQYLEVLNSLPESRQSSKERAFALAGYRDASILLAKVRISEGRYTPKPGQRVDSAEEVLRTLLERDPDN
ncbi:MAG: hypothetical protein EBS01_12395, partial [Verrucomicrobia bacterium]|nr:hypothetical protein [Verrucomicrobiota bacterium]